MGRGERGGMGICIHYALMLLLDEAVHHSAVGKPAGKKASNETQDAKDLVINCINI